MKRINPYPLLFVTAVIFDRVAASITQIDPLQSLRSLSVLLPLCIVGAFIFEYFVKDRNRADFMVFIIIASFVLYRSLYGLIVETFPQQADYLGIVLTLLLGWLYTKITSYKLWRSIRNPARITYYFNIVFAVLLLMQAGRLGKGIYGNLVSAASPQLTAIPAVAEDIHLNSEVRPDIYVIILDGYARQDVLKSMYAYDNSGFISELEKRGFYVPAENHSNYIQTPFTMASLWNFEYVQPWEPPSDYHQYLLKPIQNNRVFHLLDEIGYTTVSFEGPLSYTQIKNSDVYLTNFLPVNKFESLLLVNSPLEPLSNIFNLRIPIPSYKTHQTHVLYEFDTLPMIPASIPGPKIVYAHIMAPHPPFVFDQNGNVLPQEQPYRMWDDSDSAGGQEKYRKGYREQLIFINREILEAIDGILANSEAPPVILVMGDHGPASMFYWNFDKPGCIWERTSNLYALLLPGVRGDGMLYASISPVNTFRVIFNTYFATDLPLLEDRTYLAASQFHDKIKDVTATTDSRIGCTNAVP